jgi:hypothetical protein
MVQRTLKTFTMKQILAIILCLPLYGESQTLFELYSRPVKIVNSNTTLATFDIYTIVNTTTGNDTITLPPASTSYSAGSKSAVVYHIKNIGPNSVFLKVAIASADSVEGSANLFEIMPAKASKEIQAADAHNYYIH